MTSCVYIKVVKSVLVTRVYVDNCNWISAEAGKPQLYYFWWSREIPLVQRMKSSDLVKGPPFKGKYKIGNLCLKGLKVWVKKGGGVWGRRSPREKSRKSEGPGGRSYKIELKDGSAPRSKNSKTAPVLARYLVSCLGNYVVSFLHALARSACKNSSKIL